MSTLKVDTESGVFTIRMHDEHAPDTCRYFKAIVEHGDLDSGSVFRITTPDNDTLSKDWPINIIQFGTNEGLDGARATIRHESTDATGLAHHRWTVSASRYAPGEVYGSFFVCMRDEPALDFGGERRDDQQGYAAFGEVVEGHATLEAIYALAEANELLRRPIRITRVSVIDS